MKDVLWLLLGLVVLGLAGAAAFALLSGRRMVTPGQRTTYEALHTANHAAPALRVGLTPDSIHKALPALKALVGTRAVLIADTHTVIGVEGLDDEHAGLLRGPVQATLKTGRPATVGPADLRCQLESGCPLQNAVIVPLHVRDVVVGALVAVDTTTSAGLVRLCGEVARFVSTQLELADLDRSRQRAVAAELRFLRAQISPHFIYNSLTAIESFVRSDPERARGLLVSFADFTRFTFSGFDQFTTLAEELRLVDIYLDLERARFGDRIAVTLRVAPEVLSVSVPALVLQPVVENAIRHGLEPSGTGRLTIDVSDGGASALIAVEDDGVGSDPGSLERALAGHTSSVGLHNVDERLRATFGDDHGLVVETAPGAGTRVTFSVPKFHAASAMRSA